MSSGPGASPISLTGAKVSTLIIFAVGIHIFLALGSWYSRCVVQDRGQELVDGLKVCLQGELSHIITCGMRFVMLKILCKILRKINLPGVYQR